tara:strand:- start:44 stop:457 length:414 start_codon:yes stop_codon:yes gene_type:complete
MAESAKLYVANPEFSDPFNDHDRLEMFQSVAVTGKFEECVAAAYFGRNVTQSQVVILKTIHALTAKWLVGKLSQNLLDRLDLVISLADKGKDVSDIATKIMELLGVSTETDPVRKAKESRMILELTNAAEKTKKKRA